MVFFKKDNNNHRNKPNGSLFKLSQVWKLPRQHEFLKTWTNGDEKASLVLCLNKKYENQEYNNMKCARGWKHIRVSQFWRIRVPFQSPFLV
jgi:hypothetical protein